MISMTSSGQMSRLTCSLIFVLVSSALAENTAASAQTLTTLTSLTDGQLPWGSLVVDANGNLFGTTEVGGASGYGTVFEIAKTSSGYASTPTTVVSFIGSDGSSPDGGLIVDVNGDLFGTTTGGGSASTGTAFEIIGSRQPRLRLLARRAFRKRRRHFPPFSGCFIGAGTTTPQEKPPACQATAALGATLASIASFEQSGSSITSNLKSN